MIYHILNYFFFIFHTSLNIFNLLGWIFPKTRKWNLLSLLLTAFSWFVLGIWHGWGYCIFTDWHWMVRHKLGYRDISYSYNHLLMHKLTGINFSPALVDAVTVIGFFTCLTLSIWINMRDYRRRKISA